MELIQERNELIVKKRLIKHTLLFDSSDLTWESILELEIRISDTRKKIKELNRQIQLICEQSHGSGGTSDNNRDQ